MERRAGLGVRGEKLEIVLSFPWSVSAVTTALLLTVRVWGLNPQNSKSGPQPGWWASLGSPPDTQSLRLLPTPEGGPELQAGGPRGTSKCKKCFPGGAALGFYSQRPGGWEQASTCFVSTQGSSGLSARVDSCFPGHLAPGFSLSSVVSAGQPQSPLLGS